MKSSLLTKWLVRYLNPQIQGLWKTILVDKYNHTINSLNYSSFWLGVMTTKGFVDISVDKKKIGDDSIVSFWHDIWFYNNTLANIYPNLYVMVQHNYILISEAFQFGSLQLLFYFSLDDVSLWMESFIEGTLFSYWPSVSRFSSLEMDPYRPLYCTFFLYDWLEFGGIPNLEFTSIWNTKDPYQPLSLAC
jgi:hypothetical protein